jgi:hypothetical protein
VTLEPALPLWLVDTRSQGSRSLVDSPCPSPLYMHTLSPVTFLRENSSFRCRSGQLLTTSGSSISSQSTSSPDEGPSRTVSGLWGGGSSEKGLWPSPTPRTLALAYLPPSMSCGPGPGGSSSCSNREHTTATGPEAGLGQAAPGMAEKRAVSSSSRWGDRTSTRPRSTVRGREQC